MRLCIMKKTSGAGSEKTISSIAFFCIMLMAVSAQASLTDSIADSNQSEIKLRAATPP